MSSTQSAAPTPKRVDAERVHHDDVFLDPYEWMRDKSDPEVIAHLEAENTHVDEVTAYQEPLRQRIFDEIKARTKETDLSVPLRRGDWWYYGRSLEGKQYGVHCRRPISGPDDWDPPVFDEQTAIPGEQILLDENLEAEGHDYFAVGAASVSPDGHILAYSTDVVGDERYTLQFKDLRTGELSADRITGIASGITWATDSATVYYTTVDEAWRPDTVWRHRLGHAGHDEQVFTEPDERFWVAVGRTRSNAYIVIAAGSSITSEVRVADASYPQAEFVPVLPRRDGVEYSVDHVIVGGEDRFLILHNDGAPNFTLVDAPVDDPSAQRTLIPARDDVRLEGVDVFAGHIVVHDRREALPRLQLWPVTETGYGTPADITFDSELMACGLGGNPNWDAPRLRVGATSFMTPMRIYDIDLRAAEVGGGERTLLREQPVLGGYRRDFAVPPPGRTILEAVAQAGGKTVAVGKIEDIFCGVGVTHSIHTKGNTQGLEISRQLFGGDFNLATIALSGRGSVSNDKEFIFINLVDTDSLYGHRRDPLGYARALEEIDLMIGRMLPLLGEDDLFVITGDHGCDPTAPGTDHTREHVPLLVYNSKTPVSALGTKPSFTWVSEKIADWLQIYWKPTYEHYE
jgi:oligopeptidase B